MNLKITFITIGAMGALVLGALYAKIAPTQILTAGVANFYAAFASAALIAPDLIFHIAFVAIVAMVTLVYGAIHTHRRALFIGAVLADIPSGAIRAYAAFQTQLTAFCALVAILAIGRSVDPLIAVLAYMCRMNRQRGYINQTDHRHQRQQCTYNLN